VYAPGRDDKTPVPVGIRRFIEGQSLRRCSEETMTRERRMKERALESSDRSPPDKKRRDIPNSSQKSFMSGVRGTTIREGTPSSKVGELAHGVRRTDSRVDYPTTSLGAGQKQEGKWFST